MVINKMQQGEMWQTIMQHRDRKTLIMGVTWYRAEQWDRLREISADKEIFETTYEAFLLDAEKNIKLAPCGRTIRLARRTPWYPHYIRDIPPWA
jgi:hypothetical protein